MKENKKTLHQKLKTSRALFLMNMVETGSKELRCNVCGGIRDVSRGSFGEMELWSG